MLDAWVDVMRTVRFVNPLEKGRYINSLTMHRAGSFPQAVAWMRPLRCMDK